MSQKKTDAARYDRQLRLWGEGGQGKLEAAHLCLLNATAVGTETLKNLVLPGIGQFTVVDGKKITELDFNNFFVQQDAVGKSRAEITCQLLNELNDLASGTAVEKDPLQLIEGDLSFFKQFSLVIANNIPDVPLLKLSKFLWAHNIALVVVSAYGLLGHLRVVVPEHTIIESKPDNPPDDLRLATPFPELIKYAESFDLSKEKMNSTQHSHVPYIVILLQQLSKWRAEHGGQNPSSYAEKTAFRSQVIAGSWKSEEENFNEAYKAALKACVPTMIPSPVQEILNDPKASNVNATTHKFWVLAAALKEFVANEGGNMLPLSGKLPDMTASTEDYISLQKVYQEKALRDCAALSARVKGLLNGAGRKEDEIAEEEIKLFCKSAQFLQCIRFRSLADEYEGQRSKGSWFASELSNPESNVVWYLALRAANRFYTQHNRYPGSADAFVEGDVTLLKQITEELLKELEVPSTIADKYVQEMVRFGFAELHPIAALIGGIASQEIIKVTTQQYTPLNNTFVYNGMESTSVAFEA